MKRVAVCLLLCMVGCMTGCTKYYYQEGKSFAECERDCKECLFELRRRADRDASGSYENKYMDHCMKQKGYSLVTEKKLPLDVKRRDPETTMTGRTHENRRGLAGTLH